MVFSIVNTHWYYRIKHTWESATGHFTMQMFNGKMVGVYRCNSYSHVHHNSKAACSLLGFFKHGPRLSVRALVMSANLLLFFTLLLICLPQDPKRMAVATKQHIYILICIHFIHLISHMAQEYKCTPVIPQRVQQAIIFTSLLHIVFFCL